VDFVPADVETVGRCLDGVGADEGEIEELMAVANAHLGDGAVAELADEVDGAGGEG